MSVNTSLFDVPGLPVAGNAKLHVGPLTPGGGAVLSSLFEQLAPNAAAQTMTRAGSTLERRDDMLPPGSRVGVRRSGGHNGRLFGYPGPPHVAGRRGVGVDAL